MWQWLAGESGQGVVLAGLYMVVLCGLVALVIDAGIAFHAKRHAQTAADGAALAAVQELPGGASAAIAMASEYAARHGYGGAAGDSVTVVPGYRNNPGAVEVRIRSTSRALFARVLGFDAFPLEARAVATRTALRSHEYAVIVLNQTACGAFSKSGSGALTVVGSDGVAVNSSCASAVSLGGSGSVTAPAIRYYSAGGWTRTGGGTFSPAPTPMDERVKDPLADIPPPGLAGLTISPDSGGTAASPALRKLDKDTHTLRPGIYYGGLSIERTANVYFQPGIYAMAGGGLSITGSGTVTGNGILIYNTSDPVYPTRAGACAEVRLAGGTTVTLTPMVSGRYADILVWQDRACTVSATIAGNGQLSTGVFYLPGAELRMVGTAEVGAKQVIADRVTVSGNADLKVAFDPYYTNSFGRPRLVE